MKIGVISAILSSVRALQHALEAIREEVFSLIMCVGDVLCHGPRNPVPLTYGTVETVDIINNFPIPFCDSRTYQLPINDPIINIEEGKFYMVLKEVQ